MNCPSCNQPLSLLTHHCPNVAGQPSAPPIPVTQDGADFYGPDGHLWTAPQPVDFEDDSARLARHDFKRRMTGLGLEVVFPSHEAGFTAAVKGLGVIYCTGCGDRLSDFDIEEQHGTCVGCRCC